MDIVLTILCVFSILLGIMIIVRHKFYKYDMSDMLFVTKLKSFILGLIFIMVGLYGLLDGIAKLLNT
ncbi:hypothetical protein DXT99_20360 [Pontibacter diazotrophicus]|uniref:Uncharacterized protein n=1 Tax=Pontibacter diazotrophicus TaxID=1400979 RepID=A0A3D8L7M0_9BACT|nr:hypothetical protein DXT99_20360 [Pontibacter diazotrophicus]